MKQNNAKPKKKDRRRLAVQIIAIALTAIFLVGALYYTVYFAITKVREKKAAADAQPAAVTEVIDPVPYL